MWRFPLTRQNRRELAQVLGADEDYVRDYRPRYNIAPTDRHFIVTSNTNAEPRHYSSSARTSSALLGEGRVYTLVTPLWRVALILLSRGLPRCEIVRNLPGKG